MGGNITVDSVYGKGTTFTITLDQSIEEYIPIVHIMQKEKICVGILEKEEFISKSIQNILEMNQISFIQGTTIETFASVGATEISELAKILEFAGKEENVPKIEEILQEFINKFEEVLQDIGEYLNKLKCEEKEQGIETLDYLDEIDSKLKERLYQAIDGMDSITAEEVLKEINQYTYNAEIAYYLEKIGQAINDYQYDTAFTYLKLLH